MVIEKDYSTPTKWNFDEDRMKAISAYIIMVEDAFNQFTSYGGMRPIEYLYGTLGTFKRAIKGTGADKDDKALEEQFKKLEAEKRKCNDVYLVETNLDRGLKEFVIQSVTFFNVAEETFTLLQKTCTKNGWYLRKTEDPRYAALKR